MKKIISQLCSLSILATSLNVASVPASYAATNSRSEVIREVLANYSMKLEKAEGNIKAMSEAAIALTEKGVSGKELIEYVAEGMDPAEAQAYRSTVGSRLDITDSENLPSVLKEVSETMSKGSNFRTCTRNKQVIAFTMGVTSLGFIIAASSSNNSRKHRDQEIKEMRLQRTDLQSDIDILIGEGVKPDSFLIASIKKDINFLDEQMSQKQGELEKETAKVKNFSIAAAASGAVWAVGFLNNCY